MAILTSERKALGITQAQAASSVGVARSTYVAYEAGTRRPPVNVAIRIAKLFGRPVEDLFPEPSRRDGVSHHDGLCCEEVS